MNQSSKTSGAILKESVAILRQYPSFIVPLLCCWVLYATAILFFRYYFRWAAYPISGQLIILFLVIFGLSAIIGSACLVMLELVEQIETGTEPSVMTAFFTAMSEDFIRALPILFLWSALWFIIAAVHALTRRRRSNPDDEALSAESAAKVLAGMDQPYSLSLVFSGVLNDGVRLATFLVLPAVAWEHISAKNALQRGLHVMKAHLGTFASGFALTEAATAVIFLPVVFPMYVCAKLKIHLPPEAWTAILIYLALAWSLSIFIEQMFAAQLYLWHIKWLNACYESKKDVSASSPKFHDVEKPSLLDHTPEFLSLAIPLEELETKPYAEDQRYHRPTRSDDGGLVQSQDNPWAFMKGELTVHGFPLPIHVKCPKCNQALELEETERFTGRFVCPNCGKDIIIPNGL